MYTWFLTAMAAVTLVLCPASADNYYDKEIHIHEPVKFIDQEEVACLAINIYHEARGESSEGKIAVAFVTLNRV